MSTGRPCSIIIGIVVIVLAIVGVSCNNGILIDEKSNNNDCTLKDVDGNVYSTVKIGNQVWMAENLRTTKYNDGTALPLVTANDEWRDLNTPGYCYYNNTTNPDSITKYGALYNWYAVNTGKLAPSGWHVPTEIEWATLEKYLIANGYNWDGTTTGNKIGKSLAANTDWESSTDTGTIGNDLSKNNSSGFSALPAGWRTHIGNFSYRSKEFCLWSATESPSPYDRSNAYGLDLSYESGNLAMWEGAKRCGFSLRLLQD